MKILVGTTNERKLEAVRSVLRKMDIGGVQVDGCSVSSDVSGTPLDVETMHGAINRAQNAQVYDGSCDMYIGMESGLVGRYGNLFEEVWVAIITQDQLYTAYSSGIQLPNCVIAQLDTADVTNHPKVMNNLRNTHKTGVCTALGVDTWGDYTGGKIARQVGLEEAMRNTLIQIFHPKNSLYSVDK